MNGELRELPALLGIMSLCAAAYGFVLGWWRSPLLALFVAVKLPLLLIVTSGLTLLFNWVTAMLLGLRLRLVHLGVLTCAALASAAVLLASLAPVAWLFSLAAPEPSPEARSAHNLLYLMHTFFVGSCAVVGTGRLWRFLAPLAPSPGTARRIYFVWLSVFAFIGGEVAWALRPFVGSVYYPVRFFREDALDGNVYEFIFTDILPHLLST